jgi:predicted transcriptional regulator
VATILLSIKPEYVVKIMNHTKLYEFRKKIPQKSVTRIIIYSSEPEQMIVGEFEVLDIIRLKPTPLWEMTKSSAGITRTKYREYFHGCNVAFAYRIGHVTQYDPPKKLEDYGVDQPPQSFIYLDD